MSEKNKKMIWTKKKIGSLLAFVAFAMFIPDALYEGMTKGLGLSALLLHVVTIVVGFTIVYLLLTRGWKE